MGACRPKYTRDLRTLPKAELHLHLEGAMRPGTLRDLCRKYGLDVPRIPCWTDGGDPIPLDECERFSDFSAFVGVYVAACSCLRTPEDIRRLVLEVSVDLRASGVLYAEIAPSLTYYACHFGSAENTLRVLVEAARLAEDETGVVLGYIISAERQLCPDAAVDLARLARRGAEDMNINGRPAVVGFGLHGPEEGHPPGPFRAAFELACGGGLLASVPHAGELPPGPGLGARSVVDAVAVLGADRIGHGVLALGDSEAMDMLRTKGVVLDVCVTSNYLLNVVDSLEGHPLRRFLDEGVRCTINSDDPLLFGCSVLSEYGVCRHRLGMSDEVLGECARTSFEFSRAPDEVRLRGVKGVDDWIETDH